MNISNYFYLIIKNVYFSDKHDKKKTSKSSSTEMAPLQKAAHWFGTFGRKKGEKKRSTFYAIEVSEFMDANPDVDMAGMQKLDNGTIWDDWLFVCLLIEEFCR